MGSSNDPVAAIDAALAGGELDVDSFDFLTVGISNERLSELRQALLPRLLRLVNERESEALKVPASTVKALVSELPVSEIPVAMLDLQNPVLCPLVVEQLARVTVEELSIPAIEQKVREAVLFVLDPKTPAEPWDSLIRHLAHLHQIEKYLPYERLYNGPVELQGRLMAANLASPSTIPQKYAIWPLICPDDLLLAHLRLDYTTQLAQMVPQAQALIPVYDEAATIYSSTDRPLPDFARLLSFAPSPIFLELDSRYSLVARADPALLSRIDPSYLIRTHPMLLGRLSLSQATLPVFVNLIQNPDSFGLLDLPANLMQKLPIEAQAQLLFSASTDLDSANLFMRAYPLVAPNVLKINAAFGMSFLHLQRDIRENLKKHGISIGTDAQTAVGDSYA